MEHHLVDIAKFVVILLSLTLNICYVFDTWKYEISINNLFIMFFIYSIYKESIAAI